MLLVDKMTSVNSLHSSAPSEQVVRKKRTFDIAFLTGQDSSDKDRVSCVGVSSSCGGGVSSTTGGLVHSRLELDEENNSNGSSIDVTNGSVSDQSAEECSVSQFQSRQSPPPPPPAIRPAAILHPQRKSTTMMTTKIRNCNRKDEIRFESKRTIDINQTCDSLKIKENLQFSTLFPSSISASGNVICGGAQSAIGGGPRPGGGGDLHLPHISTFSLLPHMAKFPVNFPICPSSVAAAAAAAANNFSAKMEKSESLNISYNNQMNKIRSGFADPYVALANNYYNNSVNSNLMLPQDLNSRVSFQSSSAGENHPHSHHHSPHQSNNQQNMGNSCSSSATSGPGAATLLPPSLTALTLPAQNVCAKCNIGFRMTSDLVYHMRSHHKRDGDPMKKKREEKLKCPVCHESFRERHHLTRHMTAHQDRAEERDETAVAAAAAAAAALLNNFTN